MWERCGLSILPALVGGVGVLGLHTDCVGFTTKEEQRQQVILLEGNCGRGQSYQEEKEGFIMGYGGALTLVNGSPFDWVVSSAPSYQMDAWNWPTVNAGTTFEGTRGERQSDNR